MNPYAANNVFLKVSQNDVEYSNSWVFGGIETIENTFYDVKIDYTQVSLIDQDPVKYVNETIFSLTFNLDEAFINRSR